MDPKSKRFLNRRTLIVGAAASLFPMSAHASVNTGVILVGASWCSFCKQAAPLLKLLSDQGGFPVLVASHDSRPIPPFPDVVPSQTHPLTRDIVSFPVTLVYSSSQNRVVGRVDGYRNPRWYMRSVANLINQVEQG